LLKLENLQQERVEKRKTKQVWTFQGCISGHAELDWKIIAFDGLGGGN
jgi:hypothetical protein